MNPSAKAIVNNVIGELHNRRFFRWVWDDMEAFQQRELVEALVEAVESANDIEVHTWVEIEDDEEGGE